VLRTWAPRGGESGLRAVTPSAVQAQQGVGDALRVEELQSPALLNVESLRLLATSCCGVDGCRHGKPKPASAEVSAASCQ
jgi:hypothetical protein